MWYRTGSVNDGVIGPAEKAIPGHDGIKLAMPRIGSDRVL
jgi:cellobiose transport system substrate-binding protein